VLAFEVAFIFSACCLNLTSFVELEARFDGTFWPALVVFSKYFTSLDVSKSFKLSSVLSINISTGKADFEVLSLPSSEGDFFITVCVLDLPTSSFLDLT